MTTVEMIQNFHLGYDIANLEGPGYEDEEILVFLNQAQTIEVMKEVTLRRWTYITNLIVNEVLSTAPIGWGVYNYLSVATPTNYLSYISSKTLVTRTTFKSTSGSEWLGNIPIKKELSGKYISSSLNHVILIVPRVFEEEDGKISVILDRHTTSVPPNNFILEFIKRPVDIAVGISSEVNLIMHERIVNTAVDLGKKVWNPQEAGVSQQTDQLMNNPKQ
jgi:hypothetical protein